jgi:hypothetical protein
VFDSVSSIWLWSVGDQSVLESVKSVVDSSITNGMDGNLEIQRIGKVDNGKQFGWGPNRSWCRAVGVWLGEKSSTATLSALVP